MGGGLQLGPMGNREIPVGQDIPLGFIHQFDPFARPGHEHHRQGFATACQAEPGNKARSKIFFCNFIHNGLAAYFNQKALNKITTPSANRNDAGSLLY